MSKCHSIHEEHLELSDQISCILNSQKPVLKEQIANCQCDCQSAIKNCQNDKEQIPCGYFPISHGGDVTEEKSGYITLGKPGWRDKCWWQERQVYSRAGSLQRWWTQVSKALSNSSVCSEVLKGQESQETTCRSACFVLVALLSPGHLLVWPVSARSQQNQRLTGQHFSPGGQGRDSPTILVSRSVPGDSSASAQLGIVKQSYQLAVKRSDCYCYRFSVMLRWGGFISNPQSKLLGLWLLEPSYKMALIREAEPDLNLWHKTHPLNQPNLTMWTQRGRRISTTESSSGSFSFALGTVSDLPVNWTWDYSITPATSWGAQDGRAVNCLPFMPRVLRFSESVTWYFKKNGRLLVSLHCSHSYATQWKCLHLENCTADAINIHCNQLCVS